MRMELSGCRNYEMKNFCKYYSDGNCILSIKNRNAPCEKYIYPFIIDVFHAAGGTYCSECENYKDGQCTREFDYYETSLHDFCSKGKRKEETDD